MQAHVLSVGQCGYDDTRLARVLQVEADAHVDRAHSVEDAKQKIAAKKYDLVIVNRMIEGDGASGVDFIGEMRKVEGAPCFMLISDYADAQAAALANGAAPGFGKSALGTAEVGQRLRQALHSCGRAGLEEKLAAKTATR
jgi:DNA-binding response OmpR family regulator